MSHSPRVSRSVTGEAANMWEPPVTFAMSRSRRPPSSRIWPTIAAMAVSADLPAGPRGTPGAADLWPQPTRWTRGPGRVDYGVGAVVVEVDVFMSVHVFAEGDLACTVTSALAISSSAPVRSTLNRGRAR
jgi:hypothetical protein